MPESRRQARGLPRQQLETRKRAMEEIEKAYRSASEGHQWQAGDLTPQQECVLNELDDASDEMRQWRGITPEDESEKTHQLTDQDTYEKALTRAVRAGLWQHPVVREWLAARRSLGDWDELRRFRKRLEYNVKKPMLKADFWLAFEAQDLIDHGHEPEAIRKALIEKLKHPGPKDRKKWRDYFDLRPEDVERLIARLGHSRQNFYQWLQRLRLI